MSKSVGVNAGISGLLDLPAAAGGALLRGVMAGFGQKLAATGKPRRGRGGNNWAKARALVSSGSVVLSGRIDLSAVPLPTALEDQEGTLSLRAGYAGNAAQTESMPVRVTGVDFRLDEKTKDAWDFVVTCQILGAPTWAGFASAAPAAAVPTKADQEQWGEGTTKTHDPSGLLTGATRTTDVWGSLPDTDTGEADRLAAIVAAALAPIAGLKLRTATFTRDSADGGTVTETWGLTSTADDQLNPRTVTNADPQNLVGTLTTAALIDPGAPPADPAAPSGYKLVGRDDYKLNDGVTARVYRWGLVDSKDAKEFEQARALTDPQGLTGTTTSAAVFTTGSPPSTPAAPAGLKLVSYFDVPITAADTSNQSLRVWTWGTKDSLDALLNPRTTETADPADLRSQKTTAVLIDPDTPPADPDPPPAGYKLHHVEDVKEVDGTGTVRVYHWGLTDAADETEFERNQTLVDPNGIRSRTTLAKVFTTGSPPSTPAAPAGQKLLDYFDAPLTAADTSNQSVRVFRWATADSRDELLNPKNTAAADPKDLRSTIDVAILVGDAAPDTPAGYKLAATLDAQVPEGPTVRVYRYALTDAADDVLFKYSKALTDPNNLTSETVTAALFTTGAAPADPSAPAGLKLVDHFDVPLTAADTSNQSVRVYRWGLTDSSDAILNPKTTTDTDPADLRSRSTTAVLFDPGSPPADPAAASGYKLVGTSDVKVNDDKWARVYAWGLADAKDEAELGRTRTLTDPAGLAGESATAAVFTTGSPPADPAAPSGMTLVDTLDVPLTAADTSNQSIRVYRWGLLTRAEEVEHRGTTATEDPTAGTTTEETAVSTVLSTDTVADLAASALAAVATDPAVDKVVVRKENKTRAVTTTRSVRDDLTIRASVRTRQEKVLGTPSTGGWSATPVAATVRVARVPTIGANNTVALIQHQTIERTRGQFVVRRRLVATDSASVVALCFPTLIGLLNNGVFLDQDAHTLKYGGYDVVEDLTRRDGSHAVVIDYYFDKDSLFHQNETNLAYGWVPTQTASTYITDPGFYVSTAVFATDMEISFPDDDDLSVILA